MVSKIEPGRAVLDRIGVYRLFTRLTPVRASYHGKFALAAAVGMVVPVAIFVVYLLVTRSDFERMYPLLAALLLACFMGFLGTLWALRELLVPIDLTAEALRSYIESREVPDLPIRFPDRAGKLMEGTQYTLGQLHQTITRLEGMSDIDDLTGVYNRRSGEKRLGEEVARGERDLQSFQLAFLDINEFKRINERHGHSAGDACISHVAALLALNVRRGDWVARWGADEFVVGLHRNRALKMVMGRIVKAVESSPCEVAPGVDVNVHVSCGVAEYRFGSGADGLLADAGRAMYAAKELARGSGESHVCYRAELDLPPRSPQRDAARVD
ncbi:MAG TPA: GGDEF domain-containing protein [Usitatibacter sp.]|jgi:diguanylate cyclase (GGDEF)-like protein|nr:GGDEF domain-containing protein [Usitatibacter sp.]